MRIDTTATATVIMLACGLALACAPVTHADDASYFSKTFSATATGPAPGPPQP